MYTIYIESYATSEYFRVELVTEIGNKVLIGDDEYLAFYLSVYYIITQSSLTNDIV